MKTLFTIILLSIASVSFSRPKPQADYKVIWVKKSVLYFKVDKAFVGGVIEIYDGNKELMETEELPHTHTMVYFEEMPTGRYTIKVKKGNKTTEFGYSHL
jgi:hypothetical protein